MARKSRKHPKTEENNSTRAATFSAWVYARISNVNNHTETSVNNQIAICTEYINKSNDLTFESAFIDSGYSGTNFERPGYIDMMADILSGKVKCVVVKDLSRLGRSYIEVGELLFNTFTQFGVRFISVNEHYDSSADDAGRKKLFVHIKNLMNHAYSIDLRKKINATISLKKQRGEPLGLPAYGYIRSADKKQLEIDATAAETVKIIFDMRIKGNGAYSIAKYLNQNNIPSPINHYYQTNQRTYKKTPKSIMWSANAINRILHNETYTGSLIQDKYSKNRTILPKEQWTIRENAHPAIIAKELFADVKQMLLKSALKYKRKTKSAIPENRYTGKIFCSRCGKTSVRRENRKSGGTSFYYNCRYCVDELKQKGNIQRA